MEFNPEDEFDLSVNNELMRLYVKLTERIEKQTLLLNRLDHDQQKANQTIDNFFDFLLKEVELRRNALKNEYAAEIDKQRQKTVYEQDQYQEWLKKTTQLQAVMNARKNQDEYDMEFANS
jgi:cell division FtsZ-interacting protein ZapD